MKEFLEDISDFYHKRILQPIDRFFLGIRNLIFWAPIIWMDRDWDDYYLLKMMEIKIRRMRKFFIEKGVAIHSKKELRDMLIVANVLSRLRKSEYSDYLYDKLDEKWGPLRFVEVEHGPCWVRTESVRGNVKTEEDEKQVKKEMKWLIEHEKLMLQQDLDLLASKIKHVRKWWD